MEWKGGGDRKILSKLSDKRRGGGGGGGGGVSVRIWVNLSGVGIGRIGGVDFAKTI